MQDDWRLNNQMDYLYRSALKRATFQPNEKNDHEHCEFCWEKFGLGADRLKPAYCTLDEYRWICDECFEDFHELFEWTVLGETAK